jgi:hypothetical protein
MTSVARSSALAVLIAAVAVAAYLAGVAVGKARSRETFPPLLASVQLELGLNHLERLRELESDLSRGCSSEALAKVQFDSHTQMLVLSSIYKENQGTWVVEEVAKRDPTMPKKLEQFRQVHNSWTEPKCTK